MVLKLTYADNADFFMDAEGPKYHNIFTHPGYDNSAKRKSNGMQFFLFPGCDQEREEPGRDRVPPADSRVGTNPREGTVAPIIDYRLIIDY